MKATQPAIAAATGSQFARLVLGEQTRLLFGSLPGALLSNALVASLLVVILWSLSTPPIALPWLGLMGIVLALRMASYFHYRNRMQAADFPNDGMLRQFRTGVIATGLVWGLAGVVLFPPELTHQVFLAFVLAGVSAAGITSLSVDQVSVRGFVLPTLLPLALNFVAEGSVIGITMGLMIAASMLFALANAKRLQRNLEDNVRLRVDAFSQSTALRRQQQLIEAIAHVQSQFIRDSDRNKVFDALVKDILALTDSEYGFVGKVLHKPDGSPYLKMLAMTDISWDQDTWSFYQANAPEGLEFLNMHTLFGAAITGGRPVLSNDPAHDPRSGGLPAGHPPLRAFAGLPIQHGGELVAMLGVANRPQGYDQHLVDFLQPLLITIGQLVHAARIERLHQDDQVQLDRLSQVASQTTNSVLITDSAGRVEWVNAGFTRISGYVLEEIRGRRPEQVLAGPETDADTLLRMRRALDRGEPLEVEILNYAKSGAPYWVHLNCNPVRDRQGALRGFIAIESDITQQKEVERALIAARDEAENANQAKSEFLSRMSHELRTPMNAILGFAQLLEYDDELSEEQQDNVHEILKAGNHLLELINEVLDLAKIEAGHLDMSIEPVELGPLVNESLGLLGKLAERRGIRISQSGIENTLVMADRMRLKQSLLNLLSNAIKYNREGGSVMLSSRPMKAGRLQILVADTGPGISVAHLSELFKPFNRLDKEHTSIEGTGIGLALTRRLVELMGGTISVDSELGKGSCFVIELPGAEYPGIWSSVIDTTPGSAAQHSLLLVANDAGNLRLVDQLLGRRPQIRMLSAHTPALGLELAVANQPDLILLDIDLFEDGGQAFLRTLGDEASLARIPVIALSGDGSARHIARAKASGFRDLLGKPLDANDFYLMVDRVLE